jgi:redox-sensing transcriptional repressor
MKNEETLREETLHTERSDAVSEAVIRRLPRYFRYLRILLREGKTRISSGELSKMMHVTASQIRQDFNCFGGFGQQGYGYNVEYLYDKICEILGVQAGLQAVLVGAGNLGCALARNPMFEKRGVTVTAMFDVDSTRVGSTVAGIPVYHAGTLTDYCREHVVDLAVLTLPKECALDTARELEAVGVAGIWNFTGQELRGSDHHCVVENVHLGDSLMTLCYQLCKERGQEQEESDV